MKTRLEIYQKLFQEKYNELIVKNPNEKDIEKATRAANIYAIKNTNTAFYEQDQNV